MVPSKLSLKSLAKRLVERLERAGTIVERLYVFGSHARGEARPGSDIDILVVSRMFAGKDYWSRSARISSALSGLSEPVQLHPISVTEFDNPVPGGFLAAIMPDLKLLYRRTKRRHAVRGARPNYKRQS